MKKEKSNGLYLGDRNYTYAKVGILRDEYITTFEKYLSQSAKSPQIDITRADTVTIAGSGRYYFSYKSNASDLYSILERVKRGK